MLSLIPSVLSSSILVLLASSFSVVLYFQVVIGGIWVVFILKLLLYSLCGVIGSASAACVIVRCDFTPPFYFCRFFVVGVIVPVVHYCFAVTAGCFISLVPCLVSGGVPDLVSGGVPGWVLGGIPALVPGGVPGWGLGGVSSLVPGGVPG